MCVYVGLFGTEGPASAAVGAAFVCIVGCLTSCVCCCLFLFLVPRLSERTRTLKLCRPASVYDMIHKIRSKNPGQGFAGQISIRRPRRQSRAAPYWNPVVPSTSGRFGHFWKLLPYVFVRLNTKRYHTFRQTHVYTSANVERTHQPQPTSAIYQDTSHAKGRQPAMCLSQYRTIYALKNSREDTSTLAPQLSAPTLLLRWSNEVEASIVTPGGCGI